MSHPLDEVDDLIDDLARLEDLLQYEIEKIHACDFQGLEQLQRDKQLLVPVIHRANSVVHAVTSQGVTIEDDPDLYDLALALVQLSKVAEDNQRVVGAAIKATQITIKTMVNALRSDTTVPNPRYSRSGNLVIAASRRSAGLAHGRM